MKNRFICFALTAITLVFCVVIAAISINRRGPHYKGHSLTEWLSSTNNVQKREIFRELGSKSFPFLIAKLNGQVPDRERACTLIGNAFEKAQVQNTEIEKKIRNILAIGNQGEQYSAYFAIRELGLKVPDNEIATAAQVCPSIMCAERERLSKPKLVRLHSMTNASSIDCDFLAQLCNDPDAEVQMLTLDHLGRLHAMTNDQTLCREKIAQALILLMKNTKDSSVLHAALAYIAARAQDLNAKSSVVCQLLKTTSDSSLQMECLDLLDVPLTNDARDAIGLLCARSNVDTNVLHLARDMLNNRVN